MPHKNKAQGKKRCKGWGPITFLYGKYKEVDIGTTKKMTGLFVSRHGKSPASIIKIKDEEVFVWSSDSIVIPAFPMDKFLPCKWTIPWSKMSKEDRSIIERHYYEDLSALEQKEVHYTRIEFQ